MSDEETVSESVETPEATEEAPSTPDTESIVNDWLQAKGIDPNEFDIKKAASLSKWEKEVSRKSSELGAIAKQLESAPKVAEPSVEFDPAELKNLKDALKAIGVDPDVLSNQASFAATAVEEQMEEVADTFFESHNDLDKDVVIDELLGLGINPNTLTPAKFKKALNQAYKVAKANTLDIDAIVEKRLAAKLAELKGEDEEVVSVKKGRSTAAGGHKNLSDALDDTSLSFWDKMKLVPASED